MSSPRAKHASPEMPPPGASRFEHYLPLDRQPPVVPSFAREQESVLLSGELQGEIGEFCARRGQPALVLLLAALQALLWRYSGRDEIVVGAPRRRTVLELAPLRARMYGGMTAAQCLLQAAEQADVWHCFGEPDELAGKSRLVDAYAARAGRRPADIARSTSVSLDDQPWPELRAKLAQLRALGVSSVVLDWPEDGVSRLREFRPEIQVAGHP